MKPITYGDAYSDETADIERRRKLAEQLNAQASTPLDTNRMAGGWAIPISPLEGLAKVAQGAAGSYQEKRAGELSKALREKQQTDRSTDMTSLAAMLRGNPGSPAPAEELGGGPAMPAQPGGRVDPAMLGNLRSPEVQQMGQQMWLQQMQRDNAPPQRVDLGDKIGLVNAAGNIVGTLPKGATPDAVMREQGNDKRHLTPSGGNILSAQTTMRGQDLTDERTRSEGALGRGITVRGQDLTDARARETAERDKFGNPMEVTGPNGPMLAMQNKRDGSMVDANTRLPVAQVGPKIGEAAQKQQTGVETTKEAITEYRDALKTFSVSDLANPASRARMGTVYNNMLLQAKEAYNLGVLNGPDYMILQQVITNPATMTGAITSKKALDDQAKKLDEIMGKIGGTISNVQSGLNRRATDDPLGIRKK